MICLLCNRQSTGLSTFNTVTIKIHMIVFWQDCQLRIYDVFYIIKLFFLIPFRAYRTLLAPFSGFALSDGAKSWRQWWGLCMNTDVLLHQMQNSTASRSHTHTRAVQSVLKRLRSSKKRCCICCLSESLHPFILCPSKGNFHHCVPLYSPGHSRSGIFMLTGLIWPIFPFYSRSLQILEAPRIHSHHQMTWGDNKHRRPGQFLLHVLHTFIV